MKLLISILLLTAIGMSYYMVNSLVAAEVSMPPSSFSFPDSSAEKQQLEAMAAYQFISTRPLFNPERQPPEIIVEEKVIVPKPVARELKVQALGIAVSAETFLAIVKDLRNGTIHRLKINEAIDGWTLTSVSADSFIFTKDETEKVVRFKNNGE